jgi:Arsenical resistance operon protein ArsD
MTVVHVFDPAMCCSTGVCGPSVDPQVVRFAAHLDWLKSNGVLVERFNLAQQPAAFVENIAAKAILETTGEAGLPLVIVNGQVKCSGVYPSRAELASWVGISVTSRSRLTVEAAEPTSSGCCGPSSTAASASTKSDRCC